MKNNSNKIKCRKIMFILLVLMVSAIVILPSGCLDSEEEENPIIPYDDQNNESTVVDIDHDPSTDFAEDTTPSEQADDNKPVSSYSSQRVDPPFTSGGNSGPSNTPATVEDVTIDIPSGSYTFTETHVGNLTITGNTPGTITLPATLTIDGNLTVTTPQATINNYATVGGTIDIIQIADRTWNQYGNAGKIKMNQELLFDAIPMGSLSNDKTLYIMSGRIPGGIELGRYTTLQINGGSTPHVTLLGRATVIINNTATNLPDINVTQDAEESEIDNLADESLNLILHNNASVAGNINADNESFAHRVTSRGILTVSPTMCPIGNESVVLTYTIGQDLINGTVEIEYYCLNETGATYSIAGGQSNPVPENYLQLNNITISKNQQIVLSFAEQELGDDYYHFEARSNNSSIRSRYALATLKVLDNHTVIRGISVNNMQANEDNDTSFSTNVTYDVENINVSIDLDSRTASMTINGNDIRHRAIREIPLNEPGTSTEVIIIVTAEDEVTTNTYNLTINRGEAPLINNANVSVSESGGNVICSYHFQNKSGSPVNYSEVTSTYYLDNTSSTVVLKNTSAHYGYTTSPASFENLELDPEGNITYETLDDVINDFEDMGNYYGAPDTVVLNLNGGKEGYEWTLNTEFALAPEEVSILHTFMLEQNALRYVNAFENNITISNYEKAQRMVNYLDEGALKDSLQVRIDNVPWIEYNEGTEVLNSNLSTFFNGTGVDHLRYVAEFTVHVEGNLTTIVKNNNTDDIFSSAGPATIPGNYGLWVSFPYIVSPNENHPTLKPLDRIPVDTNITVIYTFEAAEKISTIERNFTMNQSMFDNALPSDVIPALTAVQTYEGDPTTENKTFAQNAVNAIPDEYSGIRNILQDRIDAVVSGTSIESIIIETDPLQESFFFKMGIV